MLQSLKCSYVATLESKRGLLHRTSLPSSTNLCFRQTCHSIDYCCSPCPSDICPSLDFNVSSSQDRNCFFVCCGFLGDHVPYNYIGIWPYFDRSCNVSDPASNLRKFSDRTFEISYSAVVLATFLGSGPGMDNVQATGKQEVLTKALEINPS